MFNRGFASANRSVRVFFRILATVAVVATVSGFVLGEDRPEIVVNDTRTFPESITSTANGTVFFGSMSKGFVYRAIPNSTRAQAWIKPETAGLHNVLGVFADERSNTLWVCSSVDSYLDPVQTGETTLKAFELKTGHLKVSYRFPDGKGICNDIAVSNDGTIYASETSQGKILRLKKNGKNLEDWSVDPLLASADGIALLADGAIYVNGFRTGALVRVPVRADGSAGPVVKLATSRTLVHPDGMRSVGPNTMLLAEGEGRLDEVTINGDKAEIRVVKDNFMGGPTAVTLVGNKVFVLEAQLNYRNEPSLKDKDPGPFRAVAVPYQAPKK